MSDGSSPAAAPPDSPRARRIQPRRWFDLRIILGLLLVISSVIVGARVIGAADDSIQVWAARADLAAGSVIRDGDVHQVEVRIDDNAAAYLGADDDPVGRALARDVSAGELLPVAAIAEDRSEVSMALSVPTDAVPATVRRGQRINVYATDTEADSGAAAVLVAPAVTVDDVVVPGSGALSVTNSVQIVIGVPECAVEEVLEATAGRTLTVVVVGSSSDDRLTC